MDQEPTAPFLETIYEDEIVAIPMPTPKPLAVPVPIAPMEPVLQSAQRHKKWWCILLGFLQILVMFGFVVLAVFLLMAMLDKGL